MRIVTAHVDPAGEELQTRSLVPWGLDVTVLRKAERAWPEYPLGFKMVLNRVVEPPFLWMDGDIIVTRDPSRHLAYEGPWASRSGIDAWYKVGSKKKGTAHPSVLHDQVLKEFGVDIDLFGATDAALFYFPYLPDDYEDLLTRFMTLPEVVRQWDAGGNQRRTLDQKFLSVVLALLDGVTTRGRSVRGKDLSHPLSGAYQFAADWKNFRDREHFPNATFLHYNCTGLKHEAIAKWSSWLEPGGGFDPRRLPR